MKILPVTNVFQVLPFQPKKYVFLMQLVAKQEHAHPAQINNFYQMEVAFLAFLVMDAIDVAVIILIPALDAGMGFI
jgi:hypothetical protein